VPLIFHPGPGTIVICDFSAGFHPPEMVKIRPVIVISPRRRSVQLVTVVPLSSSAPMPVQPWHIQLPHGAFPPARGVIWAKCDMVATVGFARLDRVKARLEGRRVYQTFQLGNADFAAILAGVRAALGLS
jgi:mRNA interferase MazF